MGRGMVGACRRALADMKNRLAPEQSGRQREGRPSIEDGVAFVDAQQQGVVPSGRGSYTAPSHVTVAVSGEWAGAVSP